ncbi:MAG TPA: transglutaminase family protein [Cyclobacteriaceae bacterium]|nr:transglutaminase family protein [Cyclobacteriaceae bacterium]
MSKFKIRHVTRYLYEDAVRDSANQVMLYPIDDDFQEIQYHTIVITGNPQLNVHEDYYGNKVGTFTHAQPHRELVIDSQLVVVTRSRSLPADNQPVDAQWTELHALKHDIRFIDFLRQENFSALDELRSVMEQVRCKECSPLASARDLCKYVFDEFRYRKGITTVETTVEEIWKIKSGVCQDFAHILLVMLRQLGIPSRYVSGYICPNKSGMRGEGATHAWVEAYMPQYGWLGLDPTNNCIVNETHVRLAVGKNFSDCSPVKGTYRGTSNHTLEVSVTVSYEDGNTSTGDNAEVTYSAPKTSEYHNSFRRYQEMQQQQ